VDPLPASAPADAVTPAAPLRTAVVALGSIVMGDDGAGAAVLAALEAGWELPAELDRMDLGTPGPYFAEYVRGYDALVVIDALRTPGAPGTVRAFDEHELRDTPCGPRLTPHVLDLGEALATLDFEGLRPARVRVVGVVPQRVRAGTELSPTVAAAVPAMAEAVAGTLRDWGFDVTRRAAPAADVRWWS